MYTLHDRSPNLQDVTSYVIARTLGVVDSTKASTSDLDKHRDCASTATSPLAHPIVLQQEEDEHAGLRSSMSQEHHASVFIAGGNRDTSLDEACLKVPGSADSSLRWPSASSSSELDVHHLRQAHSPGPTAFFFNPSEEHNLALSGANILSPAASRQNSPPLERRRQQHNTTDVSDVSNSTFGSDIELCTQNEQAGSLCVDDGSILRRRGGHSGDVDKRD